MREEAITFCSFSAQSFFFFFFFHLFLSPSFLYPPTFWMGRIQVHLHSKQTLLPGYPLSAYDSRAPVTFLFYKIYMNP